MAASRNRTLGVGLAIGCTLALLCAGAAVPLAAQQNEREDDQLVGTWRLTINPGTPGEFFVLVTYHRDNTQAATTTLTFLSPAFGVWKKIPGAGLFGLTHESFWDCPSSIAGCVDGLLDARIVTRGTVQVWNAGTLSGSLSSEFLRLDGSLMFSTQATVTGTRMTLLSD
jgi:hypothetical protein